MGMTEVWSPIPFRPDYYEASTEGRIRSLASGRWVILTSRAHPRTGYRHIKLCPTPGRQRTFLVHRLVALAFYGPSELDVRHLDGDQTNNRLTNLRYGTPTENAADTLRHGRNASVNRTHCPQGHPYTADNTYAAPGKRERRCRECAREWDATRARDPEPAAAAKRRYAARHRDEINRKRREKRAARRQEVNQ